MLGQVFSDLGSENTGLLAKLASVLKNLSTPMLNMLTLLIPSTIVLERVIAK
jgi:hypothetical protein